MPPSFPKGIIGMDGRPCFFKFKGPYSTNICYNQSQLVSIKCEMRIFAIPKDYTEEYTKY